jgi:hypothetical protein
MSGQSASWETEEDQSGCAYILDECGDARTCGAPLRPSSPYCPTHHMLCHVAPGSEAAAGRLREVEALASAVGGRRSRVARKPSRQFLRRLEHVIRVYL